MTLGSNKMSFAVRKSKKYLALYWFVYTLEPPLNNGVADTCPMIGTLMCRAAFGGGEGGGLPLLPHIPR